MVYLFASDGLKTNADLGTIDTFGIPVSITVVSDGEKFVTTLVFETTEYGLINPILSNTADMYVLTVDKRVRLLGRISVVFWILAAAFVSKLVDIMSCNDFILTLLIALRGLELNGPIFLDSI